MNNTTDIENGEATRYTNEMKVRDGDKFKVSGWGYRHQQCLILFFCLTIAYSMRACMGVSLVAMTDTHRSAAIHHGLLNYTNVTQRNHDENSQSGNVSDIVEDNINENNKYDREEYKTEGFLNSLLFTSPYPSFEWNKKLQDTVTASFFWGYMVLQVPTGQLAHRFGARRLLTGALTINSVVSFCLPWAAYYGGWICTMLCRILQGLSQACVLPSLHTFFGKWAPLEERARLTGSVLGGQALGTVLGLPMSGFIAASPLGWPGIFRFFGLLSGAMAVVVYLLVADNPGKHPKISTSERRHIEEGLGVKAGFDKKHLAVPWLRILQSRAVLAIVIAHIGQTWGQLTLYSEVPAFMDKVMGVNIKANGMLTALPFLVMWFTSFFFNWFTDMLIVRKLLSPTNARKVANSLGCVPPAIGLVILAFVPKDIYTVESLLVIICAFKISSHVGFMVNHIDVSPNFAGTIMSLSNFVSNMVGSLAPLVAGFILTDVTNEYQWRIVFIVAAGLYFVTNLVYVVIGTAEKADWNEPHEEPSDKDQKQQEEPMLPRKRSKLQLVGSEPTSHGREKFEKFI